MEMEYNHPNPSPACGALGECPRINVSQLKCKIMEITATNRQSAKDLVTSTGNAIEFAYAAGTLAIDQMEYAEVSRDGAPAVPVLMMKSTNNVVATFKEGCTSIAGIVGFL